MRNDARPVAPIPNARPRAVDIRVAERLPKGPWAPRYRGLVSFRCRPVDSLFSARPNGTAVDRGQGFGLAPFRKHSIGFRSGAEASRRAILLRCDAARSRSMTPGVFGVLAAGCLGAADFMGRFSSRGIGHHNALLGMLSVGVLLLTVRAVIAGEAVMPAAGGYHLLLTNGVATTAMTLLLYNGLARGPISVVMSIVAAHPVLVVLYYATTTASLPSSVDLAAMFWTIIGTIIVACWAEPEGSEGADAPANHRPGVVAIAAGNVGATVLIAAGSSVAYAILIIAGQSVAPIYGEEQTLWYGRIISLATLLSLFALTRRKPFVPMRWWPFMLAQGILDAGGYMALFAGSTPEGRETVAVVASAFGAITILFARLILKERIVPQQWFGMALVFSGVVVLSSQE